MIDNSLRAASFAQTPNRGGAVDVVGIGSELPLAYLPRPRLTRRLSGVRLIRVANYRCDRSGGGEY